MKLDKSSAISTAVLIGDKFHYFRFNIDKLNSKNSRKTAKFYVVFTVVKSKDPS